MLYHVIDMHRVQSYGTYTRGRARNNTQIKQTAKNIVQIIPLNLNTVNAIEREPILDTDLLL